MKREKIILIIAVAMIVVNIVLLVLPYLRRAPSGMQPDDLLTQQLRWSDMQAARFRELKQAHHEAVSLRRDSIQLLKHQLLSQLKAGKLNDETLRTATTHIAKLQQVIDEVTFRHFADLRALCSPEQLPHFDALIEELAVAIDRRPPPGKGPRP